MIGFWVSYWWGIFGTALAGFFCAIGMTFLPPVSSDFKGIVVLIVGVVLFSIGIGHITGNPLGDFILALIGGSIWSTVIDND